MYWKNERYLQSLRLYLIHIEFNINQRHPLVHFIVMFNNTVNSFWLIFKHQIEVKLFLISRWAEVMLQAYNIWVIKNLHCLQLTVLVSHILKNFLYSYSLTSFQTPGLLIVISKKCKNTSGIWELWHRTRNAESLCPTTDLEDNSKWTLPHDTFCHVTNSLQFKKWLICYEPWRFL